VRLELAMAVARAAGRLSRLSGRGGGTTLPGALLARLAPGALSTLAARLPQGCALVSATNGKTTTAALAAEILAPRFRLARNTAGANLASGVASALLAAPGAELGLLEVDEAALPAVAQALRPRALCLGNLFRDQLDRYGELELVAEGWRRAVAELPPQAALVVNADDPLVAELAHGRPGTQTFGIDDPACGSAQLAHAADSKYCRRCGAPYGYAAVYVGHLGDYRCPRCGQGRPRPTLSAQRIVLRGTRGAAFDLVACEERRRVELGLPGLYNVYNALAAAALARALGASWEEIVAGLERGRPVFGRAERIAVAGRTLLVLLIKNPVGANEVVRTLLREGRPARAVICLNDGIADGRDVSWIWDVDFEPLAACLSHLIAAGERAAELALRFKYAGMPLEAIEVVPDLGRALDRGLALTPPGGELVCLPTYTAMLALQRLLAARGHAPPYWERAA
jgi:UDP-N-acetylmuramyl tripeptide synthase